MAQLKNKKILAITGSLILFLLLLSAFFYYHYDVQKALTKEFFKRGTYYFNEGVYSLKNAEKWFKLALVFNPKLSNAHYQLARIYFIEKNFQKAFEEINAELAQNPQNQRSYYIRGLVNGYSGDYAEAVEDFNKFIQWEPRSWAGYNDLAWVYNQIGEYEKAKKISQDGLTVAPQNPFLVNALGVAYLGLENYDKAENLFNQALKLSKDLTVDEWKSAYPGNNPSWAYENLGKFRNDILSNFVLASAGLPEQGTSVPACSAATYYHCVSGACSSFTCDPDHEDCSSSCAVNADCKYRCQGNACVLNGTGPLCDNNAQCLSLKNLTVSKSGTGSGTVTSNPAGINCGSTCSASYTSGTSVTLAASASSNSAFAGWSGDNCLLLDNNNPGIIISDVGIGTWSNPQNAANSDDVYAKASLMWSQESQYLRATNFGFSIPSGSIIQGIKAEIERSSANPKMKDKSVRIVKNDVISGKDKANATVWPETDAYAAYGSSSDLWGLTWTADDINSANFGVVISVKKPPSTTGDALIDHIRIKVYYSNSIGATCAIVMSQNRNVTATFNLSSISSTYVITPASPSKQVGQTQQFTGWYDSDGPSGSNGNQDVTSSATWSSSNSSIATINSSGLATCVSAGGPITITSVYSGITATASLTCSASSPPFCRDGICNGAETCSTCAADCGTCLPDFSLNSSNTIYATILQNQAGDSSATTITVAPFNGFSSNVSLSVQSVSPSLPTGSTFSFSRTSLNSSQYSSGSQFNVHIGAGLSASQTYTITIKAVDGGLVRTTNVLLNAQVRNPDWREI